MKSRTNKPRKSKRPTRVAPKRSGAAASPTTEKVRKSALAEIGARIGKLDEKAPAQPVAAATATPNGKGGKTKAVKPGTPKADKPKNDKRVSGLDAAAKVLADSDKPMRCKEIVEAMQRTGLWSSPGGKTPAATINAAMIREIATKGDTSRFKKVERGLFAPGKAA